MWVGSNYGLNRLDPRTGEWRSWNVKDGLRGDKVRAVAIDHNGEVWTGAYPGGLARFSNEGKFIASYGKESGLSSEYIWGLLADRENRIWVGANGGVFRSLPATSRQPALVFEQLEIPASDPTETFRQPIVDSRGWIWVPGTNGLARFKNGRWTRYTAQNGLLSDSTWGVAEAADGAIWVIYSEPLGVTRLNLADENKLAIKHFTAEEGLSPGKSYFIGGSPNGAIWVGGERGVDAFIDGSWHHFSPEDGLIWEDCDTNSFWADPNGDVWIGTSHGLSFFRVPKKFPQETPTMLITSVQFGKTSWHFFDAPFDNNQKSVPLKIKYADRSGTIGFAALTSLHEDELRFRYRLKDLEQDWKETQQREIHYPTVPAGQYTFEVMAQAPGGSWGLPQEVAIAVDHPWWGTIWFWLLVAAALLLGLWGSWKWRMRWILRQHMRLEQEVEMRTAQLKAVNMQLETAREAAEAANRAKSDFLANVGHEIRTPMNGIVGMTDLAINTDMTEEQREFFSLVKVSADTLMDLINGLLDFSKIESGKLTLDPAPFDLIEVLSVTMKSLAASAQQKGLDLRWEINDDVPTFLLGDSVRIRQVLVNLVANAIKFTRHGEVVVSVRTFSQNVNGVCLQFSIRDTGIGVPEEKLDLIFAPFEQADRSTTRKYGGTGLGLAICSRLVQLMGGKLWAESKVGTGSTFHFTACFDAHLTTFPASAPSPLDHAHAPAKGILQILVAEDNPVNQRLAVALLERMGHRAAVAENGHKVLEALEKNAFDVVLMDVQMPEMDGLATTAAIRTREKKSGAHIPIIAMTAQAMSTDREQCLSAGMDGYISKPISPAELGRILEAVPAGSPRK